MERRPGRSLREPGTAETPDTYGAYPRLSDGQIAKLAALGHCQRVKRGEPLSREGDRNCDFLVVRTGTVAVVEALGTAGERIISTHGLGTPSPGVRLEALHVRPRTP